MYVYTDSGWSTRDIRCHTAGALRSGTAHSLDCLPFLFATPEDAIGPSIYLPRTVQCPIAANPPSLTASNCIKPASNSTTTRAQPDDDDNIDLSRTKTSSRPSHSEPKSYLSLLLRTHTFPKYSLRVRDHTKRQHRDLSPHRNRTRARAQQATSRHSAILRAPAAP
jgi:hypothetical protein